MAFYQRIEMLCGMKGQDERFDTRTDSSQKWLCGDMSSMSPV